MENRDKVVLFKNVKKAKGSNQPDYAGFLYLNDVKKDVAMWNKVSKSGKDYLSGTISEPRETRTDE